MKRLYLILLALAIPIAFALAGCGGGGGDTVAISGSVTDVAGNLVPGADIYIDGNKVSRSLMNGTYKVSNLTSGPHNVEARAFVNDQLWVGTRAVQVYSDGPTMNNNIVIGWWQEVGDIEGTVTDMSGHALPNARVIAVAHYPQDRPADEASVISKVAIANSSGAYQILDLPSYITVKGEKQDVVYDVVASSVGLSGQPRGFDNSTKSATVGPGAVTRVDFSLASSSNIIPTVPPGWTSNGAIDVISYTVPTEIQSRAAQSAYDAVKSSISKRSAQIIAFKNKTIKRSPPPGALIENNVIWYYIWNSYFGFNPPANLAGFTIYRATNRQPQQTGGDRIDFFRDPAIVTYADTSSSLTAGVTYYYGVSAVSTSYLDANDNFNPLAESQMSYPASVTPLDRLFAVSPSNGTNVSVTNPRFTWSPVSGGRSYRVFIYDAYPILDAMFTPQGDPERPDHLPAWGETDAFGATSVTFSDSAFPMSVGHEYWWVVMAGNSTDFDTSNAYAISELRSFVAR